MENVTKENFAEKIKEGKVIVDFWAEWCGPCRMLTPILEDIENNNSDIKVVKVNVDEEPELASQYQIRSIPTLYYFNGGSIIEKKIGFSNKKDILDMVSV
jgi:thioredoxin 1